MSLSRSFVGGCIGPMTGASPKMLSLTLHPRAARTGASPKMLPQTLHPRGSQLYRAPRTGSFSPSQHTGALSFSVQQPQKLFLVPGTDNGLRSPSYVTGYVADATFAPQSSKSILFRVPNGFTVGEVVWEPASLQLRQVIIGTEWIFDADYGSSRDQYAMMQRMNRYYGTTFSSCGIDFARPIALLGNTITVIFRNPSSRNVDARIQVIQTKSPTTIPLSQVMRREPAYGI